MSTRLSPHTLAVLAAFVAQPRAWLYGYDLMSAVGIQAGTLYPMLQRLDDYGFLQARWEAHGEDGRPPRHMYRLTAKGAAAYRDMHDRASARGWDVHGLPVPS